MGDFFHHGEVNIFQENLDPFLALAEELQLKGLRGNQTEKENSEMFTLTAMKKEQSKLLTSGAESKQNLKNNDARIEISKAETAIALTDHTTNNTDIESLDQK